MPGPAMHWPLLQTWPLMQSPSPWQAAGYETSEVAVAVLPALVGLDTADTNREFTDAFAMAMYVSAVLAVIGGIVAFLTIRTTQAVTPTTTIFQPCHDPCRAEEEPVAAAS